MDDNQINNNSLNGNDLTNGVSDTNAPIGIDDSRPDLVSPKGEAVSGSAEYGFNRDELENDDSGDGDD